MSKGALPVSTLWRLSRLTGTAGSAPASSILQRAAAKVRGADLEEPPMMQHGGHARQQKAGWQKRATLLCLRPASVVDTHIRRRFDRWPLSSLPGHRPSRLKSNLASISSLVPPRIIAATVRTAFNGWCTARRFQASGSCIFGCDGGYDGIEHYANCAQFFSLCQRHLQLKPPPVGARLAWFIGLGFDLHSSPDFEWPPASPQAALLAVRAIATYAIYRTHNACRLTISKGEEACQAFPAYVQEAIRGHSKARSLLTQAYPQSAGVVQDSSSNSIRRL